MRLLVVEDDASLNRHIVSALEDAGYVVDKAFDGEEGQFLGETEPYDCVILDLGLPKTDGVSVLSAWRRAGKTMPVLILTARDRWSDKVQGIDAGADDYLPKPFFMAELVARARALVRRSAGHAAPELALGDIVVDPRRMSVTRGGASLSLSPLEYRLLSYLAHHRGRVVAAHELMEHLHGGDDARDQNALEALVARLRRKIGAGVIETRRGFGYCIPDTPA